MVEFFIWVYLGTFFRDRYGLYGWTLGCAKSSLELGLHKVWAYKKNYSPVVLSHWKKFFIVFFSNTTCSITLSDFPFHIPRFDFFFLFCCLVLGLLELGHLDFGVRWVFFWEGGLRFLMYTVVIFTLGVSHIYDTLYLFFKKF